MSLSGLLRAVMGTAARRPLVVGLAVGLLAVAGGALALRLKPTAATDTLVGRGSASFAATERLHQRFGDEAVYVLVREPVTQLALTSDILRVQGLEGCISGNAPAGQVPPGGKDGPCAQLARSKPAKVVFGPGTFLNEAIGQIQDQFSAESKARDAQAKRAATAARALARAQHKTPGAGAQVRRAGQAARPRRVRQERHRPGAQVRDPLGAPAQRPLVRLEDRLRRHEGPRGAQGALRLHLPQQEQRPDPGPLPLRPQREPARPGDRPRAPGGRHARLEAAQRQGHLRRHRRAGGGQRPDQVDQPLADRPARGGARRHGHHAVAGLPRAAAPAAARRRRGGGRADLRRALAQRARR